MKARLPENFALTAQKISQTAGENNFETYIVGGFVRDLFLNRQSKDMDIMVESSDHRKTAGIDLARLISKKYGLSEPVIFERFGTAKLHIDDEEIEFIMPRKEYYQEDSRNPDTELGTLEQDVFRRDFTVNALFIRISDMEVLDITQKGFDDIKNKILRVTDESAAEFIFNQDPLRILRAVRQSLQLGFEIEAKTFAAMKKTVERISIVSPERIRDEMIKILLCEAPSKAFEMTDEIGLLEIILPEIKKLQNLKQPPKYHNDDVYRHTLKVLDRVKPSLVLRVSALLHDSGKLKAFSDKGQSITFYAHEKYGADIAQKVLSRLIFPRDFSDAVFHIVKNHIRPINYTSDWSDAAVRRLAFDCGHYLDLIMDLAKADYGKDAPDPKIFELSERIETLKEKDALNINKNFISGSELMDYFNLPPGPWIKAAKNKINETLIENPRLSKQEILEIIKPSLSIK